VGLRVQIQPGVSNGSICIGMNYSVLNETK
jgi:hypothetical protein